MKSKTLLFLVIIEVLLILAVSITSGAWGSLLFLILIIIGAILSYHRAWFGIVNAVVMSILIVLGFEFFCKSSVCTETPVFIAPVMLLLVSIIVSVWCALAKPKITKLKNK